MKLVFTKETFHGPKTWDEGEIVDVPLPVFKRLVQAGRAVPYTDPPATKKAVANVKPAETRNK